MSGHRPAEPGIVYNRLMVCQFRIPAPKAAAVFEKYTKSANRTRLAAGAIGKLDRGKIEDRTSSSCTYG